MRRDDQQRLTSQRRTKTGRWRRWPRRLPEAGAAALRFGWAVVAAALASEAASAAPAAGAAAEAAAEAAKTAEEAAGAATATAPQQAPSSASVPFRPPLPPRELLAPRRRGRRWISATQRCHPGGISATHRHGREPPASLSAVITRRTAVITRRTSVASVEVSTTCLPLGAFLCPPSSSVSVQSLP
jgi:hypothetical protein